MVNKNHPLFEKCYIVAEALYHLMGGKKSGLKPVRATYKNMSHWWLETKDGKVIDLTSGQFTKPFPYKLGKGCGFLTKKMSKRTKEFLNVIE